MRRLLLFLAAVGLFALVACSERDDQPNCSCGAPHDVAGYHSSGGTTPRTSTLEGKAVVDGLGEATVSGSDPSELDIATVAPCFPVYGDADTDAADAEADSASDAGADVDAEMDADLEADAPGAGDGGDAGDAAPRWSEYVEVHLNFTDQPGAENTFDLATLGAYAWALEPTSCRRIRVPLTGTATGASGYYRVSVRTPRSSPRAVVIEGIIRHTEGYTSPAYEVPAHTECY